MYNKVKDLSINTTQSQQYKVNTMQSAEMDS